MKRLTVDLVEIVKDISECADLVSSIFNKHHRRVACIALNIAQYMDLSLEEKRDLVLASLLHDVGALSVKERFRYLEFESNFEDKGLCNHAELGYRLFKGFRPFSFLATLIRYHHTYYKDLQNDALPISAYILHLADRVSILMRDEKEILGQTDFIKERIKSQKGRMFSPDAVDGFLEASSKESFWFDAIYLPLETLIDENSLYLSTALDIDELMSLAWVFHLIIDFRSRFTSAHSCGVSATSSILARLYSFSEEEVKLMEIAGYLHDLGKIAIPIDILEKPGKLTEEEFNIMKSHVYYSYRILGKVKGFETINTWASLHHERLDGSGYPFKLKEEYIPLGSRIMMVADVFNALTEDRPYRKGLSVYEALSHIRDLTSNNKLDRDVFIKLKNNLVDISEMLIGIKKNALENYAKFYSDIERSESYATNME